MARPGLLRNRKFGRLAGALEEHCECGGDIAAMGVLELLWATCYEAADDRIGDTLDVERAAHWRGPRGALVDALLEAGGDGSVGFIEPCQDRPGHFQVHDFWVHAPDYVRRRREREAERERKGLNISEIRSRAGKAGAAAKHAAALTNTPLNSANDVSFAGGDKATGKQKSSLPDPIGSDQEDPPIVPQGDLSLSALATPDQPRRSRKPRSQEASDPNTWTADEKRCVDFWRQQCKRERTSPTNLDIERLRDALKNTDLAGEYEETTQRLVCLAIKGCSLSDFHMGREPGKPAKHNDLSLIFRDPKHVRMFVDIAKAPRAGVAPSNGKGSAAPPPERELEDDPEERFVPGRNKPPEAST